jgi:hypothetical protein
MSLCLFGAALATANALFLQRTTCPSEHKETAALNSVRNVSSQKAASFTPQHKGSKAQKTADTASAVSQETTGSLGGGEIGTPGPADKIEAKPSKIGDDFAEWVDVSIAAKVHSAPSVSASIVRYYRVGTRLRVIERQTDWTKIVDPITSQQGWIYEKYLTAKDGPSAAQALRKPSEPSVQQRRRAWRYGAQRPRFRITFGVYPRW